MNRWIDADEQMIAGQIGFLVETEHNLEGWNRKYLWSEPACGNMDHSPKLSGWCGTTDDVAIYARGMAKVIKLTNNGRAYVQTLSGPELTAALAKCGYPELA